MKKFLLILAFISFNSFCFSQEKITYYKDKYANQPAEKGNYMIKEEMVNDSVLKKEFVHVKKNRVQWIKFYLNDAPYGIWKYYDSNGKVYGERNYEFILKYEEYIPEGALDLKTLLSESPEGFEPPMLNGKAYTEAIDLHVRTNFRYPEIAQQNNIQGRIEMQFTIDKQGNVKNLSVVNGAEEPLARETHRILHAMPTWQPARLNGEPIEVYVVYPIIFKLS